MAASIYLYFDPVIKTQYVEREVVKEVAASCPDCIQEPCTIDWKEPDKVYVISPQEPCHCGDTITDQLVNEIHVNSDDDADE